MKTITLVKKTNDVQLGHLFEHIYCSQLAEYFRKHGLFAYVDYRLDGKAYYKGLITIELDLYTPEALTHEAAAYDLHIAFDSNVIASGLLQIMAEKNTDIATYDNEKTEQRLQELNETPWTRLDEFAIEDFATNRLAKPAFTFAHRAPSNFRTLRQTISIDTSYAKSNPQVILPLFVILSKALRSNLQEEITDYFSSYSVSDTFVKSGNAYKDSNIYHVDKRQSQILTGEPDVAKELFDKMKSDGFVKRLSESLSTLNDQASLEYPNANEIMEKVTVLVGKQAWPELATEANINDVLAHMSIEFHLGGKSETVRF